MQEEPRAVLFYKSHMQPAGTQVCINIMMLQAMKAFFNTTFHAMPAQRILRKETLNEE